MMTATIITKVHKTADEEQSSDSLGLESFLYEATKQSLINKVACPGSHWLMCGFTIFSGR